VLGIVCVCVWQLTSTIKMHKQHGVPARVFFEKAYRDHFIKIKWGVARSGPATKLRNACNGMMQETEMAWRFFDRYKLRPVSTQDAVAYGTVGTRTDVVVDDLSDPAHPRRTVLEFKRSVLHTHTHTHCDGVRECD